MQFLNDERCRVFVPELSCISLRSPEVPSRAEPLAPSGSSSRPSDLIYADQDSTDSWDDYPRIQTPKPIITQAHLSLQVRCYNTELFNGHTGTNKLSNVNQQSNIV